MQNGTGQSLLEFWDYAAKKGLVNQNTANARKAAVSEVLDALGDDPTTIDVRTLDAEDALRRFENLKSAKYTPGSLTTYKSRFRKALTEYLSYLDSPSDWRPQLKSRTSAAGRGAAKAPSSAQNASTSPSQPWAQLSASQSHSGPRLIEYPFPIRDDVVAVLKLPMDLRMSEAQRLGAWLSALAMPDREGEEVD